MNKLKQKGLSSNRLMNEIKPDFKKFAERMFEFYDWPDGGDIDGQSFQDIAFECGLLKMEVRTEPCGEFCRCLEYHGDMSSGVKCFRKNF